MTDTATVAITPQEAAAPIRGSLPWTVGFFFAFRFSITYLAFQSDARLGTIVNVASGALLFLAAIIGCFGDASSCLPRLRANPVLRLLAVYLAVLGASVFWTGADSPIVAFAYWASMVMDILAVFLLLRTAPFEERSDAILRGFIAGALVVAAIAWCSPALPDRRIGDEEFLHPNGLGLMFALGALMAQHLSKRYPVQRICAAVLAISLLRTISKTSIIAFLVAEAYLLLTDRQLSRAARLRILAFAGVVLMLFAGLLSSYLESYASRGDQAETLTGRTKIWAVSFAMSLEAPWFGHGLYSFRALIPAFDAFQPWHAHNEWLQQFFELGLCGVFLTALLYFSFFRMARRSSDAALHRLGIALVIFALLHGLTDTVNFGLSLPLWLFALLALRFQATFTPRKETA